MNVLVPAYFYPGSIHWQTLLASKLDAIADVVINPHNGPGELFDEEYLKLCTRLRKAGVSILGYVSTKYGKRPQPEILHDIAIFAEWYGVNNIFLDEAASEENMIEFYAELYNSINGKVVLNHGTVPHKDYLFVGDVLVMFEAEASKLRGVKMPAWVQANRGKICQIVVNCPKSEIRMALTKVSVSACTCYITNDVEPNPYDELPAYWNQLLKAVAGA